jgi:uncharacterized protein YndB with AHSA1/START domain
MTDRTIHLHRVLRTTPERLYRAFLDADAMAKWLPPHGFTRRVHEIDARVGGSYRMSFTNFTTGESHAFGGRYLELVANERICHTDVFEDPNLPGTMQTTVTLRAVSCGTELDVVQEGIPDMIPLEACYLGWQESLLLLGQLVEAESASRDDGRADRMRVVASIDAPLIACEPSALARGRLGA